LATLNRESMVAVLFDLDGTLVDTAPDMVAVLQGLQQDHGLDPVSFEFGRAHVSNGALGLLRIAFPDAGDELRESLLHEYIARYAERLCRDTVLFDGLGELLTRLETAGRPWGVVTNKPAHLTQPLLEQLALAERLSCTVSGDTLPQKKPDPAPLLYACELAGVEPAQTIYVGDAGRDIEAGRRAGMMTIAAAYGYVAPGDDPGLWGADFIVADAAELANLVCKAVNL
jgi:phosphoglycolate phosphatase